MTRADMTRSNIKKNLREARSKANMDIDKATAACHDANSFLKYAGDLSQLRPSHGARDLHHLQQIEVQLRLRKASETASLAAQMAYRSSRDVVEHLEQLLELKEKCSEPEKVERECEEWTAVANRWYRDSNSWM